MRNPLILVLSGPDFSFAPDANIFSQRMHSEFFVIPDSIDKGNSEPS